MKTPYSLAWTSFTRTLLFAISMVSPGRPTILFIKSCGLSCFLKIIISPLEGLPILMTFQLVKGKAKSYALLSITTLSPSMIAGLIDPVLT